VGSGWKTNKRRFPKRKSVALVAKLNIEKPSNLNDKGETGKNRGRLTKRWCRNRLRIKAKKQRKEEVVHQPCQKRRKAGRYPAGGKMKNGGLRG